MRSNLLTALGVLLILLAVVLLASWEWAVLGAGVVLVAAGFNTASDDVKGGGDGA